MQHMVEKNLNARPHKNNIKADFEDVLFDFEQVLYDNREDLLEFLDPVLSDSQCQIHSMFLINKILQLCDANGTTVDFKDVKKLPKKDRILLSYAVLLTLLKYEEPDEVGFMKIKHLMDHFGIFFGQTNAEKKVINQLKTTLNSHSIEYLKEVASGKLKHLMEECDASLRNKSTKLHLQLQPCYVSFYTIFKYMEVKDLPIIIPFVRFSAETGDTDNKLTMNSKSLLYYCFSKSKNSFVYKSKKDLSEQERMRPTLVTSCFSVISRNYPEYFEEYMEGSQLPSDKFLTEDCDIRELLLLGAAGHVQLTVRNDQKPSNHTEDDVKQLFKKHSNLSLEPKSTPFTGNFDLIEDNVFGCYQHHYKVAEKFGIVNARYINRTKCIDDPDTAEGTYSLIRRNENTFFKFIHVYISTYDRECSRMNTFTVGGEVPLIEPENFCKTKAKSHVESKLSEVKLNKRLVKIQLNA